MSSSIESNRVRDIILGRTKATFVSGLPKDVALIGKPFLKPLNTVQQKAVFKT